MASRRAIIIGNNTGFKAPKFLGGVDKDIVNCKNYLKNDIGGAWIDDFYIGSVLFSGEIKVLQNKTRTEILDAIKKCNADYTFVLFSGHGFTNSKDGLTYACVKDGFISENELNTGALKQTLIMDCCREVEEITVGFSGEHFAKGGVVNLMESKRNIVNSRNKFDEALNQSGFGQCRVYACEVDQTSGDNPLSGGVFLTELIRTGMQFGLNDNTTGVWMPINDAVILTTRVILSDPFTDQTPAFRTIPSNMNLTHPFAITNLSLVRKW